MLGLSTNVFRLFIKKNTFLPFHEQFLTFFEVGLHILEVGLLGSGLGAVEGLRKFKIEFVLVFVSFSFKLERFLKFQFLISFIGSSAEVSLARLI